MSYMERNAEEQMKSRGLRLQRANQLIVSVQAPASRHTRIEYLQLNLLEAIALCTLEIAEELRSQNPTHDEH